MGTFVFRLIGPRPTFALEMSEEEREVMGRHAAYGLPLIDEVRQEIRRWDVENPSPAPSQE